MKITTLISALCCTFLAGCNATGLPTDKTKAERVRIDSLHFNDVALANCIARTLKSYKYEFVDEMTVLGCAAGPKEFNNDFKNLIYSLDGVEQLTALETLNADSNAIERVNLTGLKNLKNLSLNFNPLAQLDISNNTKLVELKAGSRSEYLKTEAKFLDLKLPQSATLQSVQLMFPSANPSKLDLRALTGLKGLTAYSVSELLLADKLSLDWLAVSGPLTQLDLSKIQTAGLEIGSPELSEIDLSSQRGLKSLAVGGGLRSLDLTANTQLTALWLDGTKLSNLELPDNLPLRFLSAAGLGFTTLDLSKLTRLEEVVISGESLTSVTGLNFSSIKYLTLQGSHLSGFNLPTCDSLLHLYLQIPIKTVELSRCKNLEFLELVKTNISQLDVSENLKLKTLYLFENPIAPHLLKLPNQLLLSGANVLNPGCDVSTTVGCADVPPPKQDTDSLAGVFPGCLNVSAAGWCRESHGQYLFAPAPTIPDSSSSSTSSSSGRSSSSSSGAIEPVTPDYSFSHAPSLEWVMQANWRFEPGEYKVVAGNYITEQRSNISYPAGAVTDFTIASPFNQRGKIYAVSVKVKLAELIPGAKISLTMVDNIIVTVGVEQIQTRDIVLNLDAKSPLTSDWVTLRGQFEFWGSSGLTLRVHGDSPFMLKEFTASFVGEGSLTGNPIIPGRN